MPNRNPYFCSCYQNLELNLTPYQGLHSENCPWSKFSAMSSRPRNWELAEEERVHLSKEVYTDLCCAEDHFSRYPSPQLDSATWRAIFFCSSKPVGLDFEITPSIYHRIDGHSSFLRQAILIFCRSWSLLVFWQQLSLSCQLMQPASSISPLPFPRPH